MNREQKAAVIDEVAGQIAAAEAIFAIDYRGITVAQVAELRAKLRESDTKLRVVKNSLTERAADRAGTGELKSLLSGPTALALVRGDVALAARALSDTARALRGPLEFKGGVLNGSLLSADDVRSIARLPAREVLHAQLVGTVAAPLTGLVRGLNALIAGLAVALKEVADKGLVMGTGRSGVPSAVDSGAQESVQAQAAADAEPQPVADTVAEPEAEPEAEREAEAEPEAEAEAEAEADPEAVETEQTEETEGEAASDAADPSDE
ncbi:MAG: 50S ribosomal protein L10 [Solirubrobacteraceae bacterium]